MKSSIPTIIALALLSASVPSNAQEVAPPEAPPVMLEANTAAETLALTNAINRYREGLGLAPLGVLPALSASAAKAFPGALNQPGEVNITALTRDYDALDVGLLRGVVTYRKPESGAEFPKYWAKDARWNATMGGDFTHMGASTVRRSDGKLVAFVYLIKKK